MLDLFKRVGAIYVTQAGFFFSYIEMRVLYLKKIKVISIHTRYKYSFLRKVFYKRIMSIQMVFV